MTDAERKVAFKKGGQRGRYIQLMRAGRVEEAAAFAAKPGCLLTPEDLEEIGKKIGKVEAVQERKLVEAAVVAGESGPAKGADFSRLVGDFGLPFPIINGWPVQADAEVVRYCINRRLVAVKLPDGREASMWKARRNYPIGFKATVRLVEWAGDPIYEDVSAQAAIHDA